MPPAGSEIFEARKLVLATLIKAGSETTHWQGSPHFSVKAVEFMK